MKRLLLSSALILGCLPVASYADSITLKFVDTGGQAYGSFYIYPYNFSINGSSALTALMCASFDNEIFPGEMWTATEQVINTHSAFVDQEDAYLFEQLGIGNYSTAEIQEAVWYLSDNTAPLIQPQDTQLLADAEAAVAAADGPFSLPQTFDNGEVAFLVPIAGSQTAGYGVPQTFLVDPKVAGITPEPGSLLLTGTGLLGSVLTVLRRRRVRA